MKEKIAGIAVFANLLLAIGKLIVGFLTGATSIFAEGIHSAMDVLSSGIGFIGIKLAKKPVDKKHPYGHHKFEVLSGLIITIILFLTGAFIVFDSFRKFQNPSSINIGYLALGIMIFSALINEIMARLKIYYGKKENSISLLSDGIHSRVDVWASIAVLIGLMITPYWIYADSLLAFLIGLYIIKESFSLGKEATDSLLDVSAGEETENKIKAVIKKEHIEISDLKTQKKGSVINANLEIKLPNKISVEEATKISNNLKENLVENVEHLEYIAIQIKSHDFTNSYFKPKDLVSKITRREFGWQRKGKFKDTLNEAKGKGPEGYCICPKCDYKKKHKKGVPCSTIKCPKCNINLTRE